jgi:hypothetical protein
MCANKKSEAHSGAHECEWMPANQVSGVHPVSGAADLSLDLANRVPQLLPFSFEFLLELINIFVCTHKTRHPPPLGVLPNSYRRSFSGSAVQQRQANGASLVHVSQNAALNIIGPRGTLTPNVAR